MTGIKDTHKLDTLFLSGSRKDGSLPSNIYIYTIMKNIYHIHQSSNSYWDNRWTDTDYYLCDTEEEYQQS